VGRRYLGPYLYLDPSRGQWVIRDRDRFRRTGCAEAEKEKAIEIMKRKVKRIWSRTIYFATCDVQDFPIKIGISSEVAARMRYIAVALPFPVLLLGSMTGTTLDEARLQKQFRHLHIKGEWFRRGQDLIEFISSLEQFKAVSVPLRSEKAPNIWSNSL
jgi:hypothetical protein